MVFSTVLSIVLAFYLLAGYVTGLLYNLLNIYLMFRVVTESFRLGLTAYNGDFGLSHWQQLIEVQGINYWIAAICQSFFFLMIMIYVCKKLPEISFDTQTYKNFFLLTIGLSVLHIMLAWLPRNNIDWVQVIVMATFGGLITFHLFQFTKADFLDSVKILSPFGQSATVVQGGNSPLFNHHYHLLSQRFAVDMVFPHYGKANSEDLKTYPCFGAPIYAPAKGMVVSIEDGFPDVEIGGSDTKNPAGNHIVIDIGNEQYIMIAHLKQGSAIVRQGDIVEAKQHVAACGNSGNTTEPHVHIQIQNEPEFMKATRTYPILFIEQSESGNGERFPRMYDVISAGLSLHTIK